MVSIIKQKLNIFVFLSDGSFHPNEIEMMLKKFMLISLISYLHQDIRKMPEVKMIHY